MSVSNTTTPEFKVLAIETTVTDTVLEGFDFVKKCSQEYSQIQKDAELPNIVNLLIFQLEEEEIIALKNPESPSYKTLKATLAPIMERLNCNIVVAIGHTESCFTYIEKNGIPMNNSLPTIVLVVACFSSSRIAHYNKDPLMIQKNIFFFGFQNLMHLLDGEILACKSPHRAAPFLDCRYEEVKEDLEVLKKNLTQFNKPYAEQVDLLKCCKGRYEHFKQVFYDYLSKRECVKFPTENLYEKLKIIRAADGSLFRNVSIVNGQTIMTEDQLKTYIFSRSEGIPCTDEGNCSTGKTKYSNFKENIAKFDDRVKFGNEATKKVFAILNETSRYTPEELIKKDKELLDIVKGIPKKTVSSMLLHPAVYKNEDTGQSKIVPLFFFIFAENYKLATQEILKNHEVPLAGSVKHSYTLVGFILEHLRRSYPKPTLTEAEAYRLIKAIGTKNATAIEVAFQTDLGILMLFENQKCYLSIIELLFRYFPSAVPKFRWLYISTMSSYVKHGTWTLAQASKVLELLCSYDKFSESKGPGKISFITAYEQNWDKLELEFVLLIFIYLQDTNKFPDTTLNRILELLNIQLGQTKDYKKPTIKRIIKVYQTAKNFFDTKGVPYSSYRKTPEEMQELLDEDLEPMETMTYAIENVKTYFSSVQPNIQKRKDLNAATKTAAIQQLVTLYKGVNSTKNEGENALRRLREMHGLYRQFLKNHPRENKKLPSVKALTEPERTENLWFYQIVQAYLTSLKPPTKPKTVRRVKVPKVVNIAVLQVELANIQSKLNSHNRGAFRLHHMTVKSLRKKKNTIEQQLRNLAPPPNPGNQGGGYRTTRKLRR
jgi:hypothetical protein